MAQIQTTDTHVLLRCGLSNRLRTLVGFWYVADKTSQKFVFHWDISDSQCNGKWSDIFEPIIVPNIKIIDTEKDDNTEYVFIGQDVIPKILCMYKDALGLSAAQIWNREFIREVENCYYIHLLPKKNIVDQVDKFISTHLQGNFFAMHIRRTDHVELAKKNNAYTSFEIFDKFCSSALDDLSPCPVFLATDNADVQKKYNQCVVYKKIINKQSLRNTSLEDALIDILIAARASKFCGSGYSSYSELINIFSRIWWSSIVSGGQT